MNDTRPVVGVVGLPPQEPQKAPPAAIPGTGWDDPSELEVAAYALTAWLAEIRHKRGAGVLNGAVITADDVKCLRQLQMALRLVKK